MAIVGLVQFYQCQANYPARLFRCVAKYLEIQILHKALHQQLLVSISPNNENNETILSTPLHLALFIHHMPSLLTMCPENFTKL